MDDIKLYKYYRASSTSGSFHALVYKLFVADRAIRRVFHLEEPFGIGTLILAVFCVVIVALILFTLSTLSRDTKTVFELENEARHEIPRKNSVVKIKPPSRFVHRHLMQTGIFQEKTEKVLQKVHLDVEFMNSRLSCIGKLLEPETQNEWRQSRTPKSFCRALDSGSARRRSEATADSATPISS